MDKTEANFIDRFNNVKSFTALKNLIKDLNKEYGVDGWDFRMKRRTLEATNFEKVGDKVRYQINDSMSTGLSKPINLKRSMGLMVYGF